MQTYVYRLSVKPAGSTVAVMTMLLLALTAGPAVARKPAKPVELDLTNPVDLAALATTALDKSTPDTLLKSKLTARTASHLDTIIKKKTLRVASVAGESTVFNRDGFTHGFGYDIARAYAHDLNVKFNFKTFKTPQAALEAVQKGQADFAMTTVVPAFIAKKNLASSDISCGKPETLSKSGLSSALNWAFPNNTDPLFSSATAYLCQQSQTGATGRLANFYTTNIMRNRVERATFHERVSTTMPLYAPVFQSSAKQQKLDWQLLVAMGYQESHLQAAAISPTGVMGLMMLTQHTAKDMGVQDRTNPFLSIEGGAKYFGMLQRQFASVPKPDRVWFCLAAYNMGPAALNNVRAQVKKAGGDVNSWKDVFQYLSENAPKNASYNQALHYVTRIRAYLETFKQDSNLTKIGKMYRV